MSGTVTGPTVVAVGGTGPTLVAVSGGASTVVAVSGVAPQDAISTYCIGLYKAKKALSTELFKTDRQSINFRGKEFKYYPNIIIEKVEKDTTDANHILITIKGGNQEATMHYSGFKNLLNASPKELIENATIPTTVDLLGGSTNADIQDFIKQITDYSYVPFCMIMQFYMNPDSILTKEYSPYELSLMTGLTIEPKENQKGELMCDFDDTLIVGTGFASINTFNDMMSMQLQKTTSKKGIEGGKYDINNSSITNKAIKGTIRGGGLKSCRGTFCPNSNLPRIYRQVLEVHKTAGSVGPYERRTDYYNYA